MRDRTIHRSPLRAIALVAVLLLVLSACSSGTSDTTTPSGDDGTTATTAAGGDAPATTEASGDTGETPADDGAKPEIVVALSDTVNLVELHTFRSTSAYSVTQALYEPLIGQEFVDENGLRVGQFDSHVGHGAESYTIEETDAGGLLATFVIRQGQTFEDGSPVTAHDYKYTLDRTVLGPGYIGLLLPFIGIDSVDQIRAVDDYTLEIETKVQSPLFERFMTFQVFGAMNEEVANANVVDDDWAFGYLNDTAIGNGAYLLSEFNPDRQIVLTPNPGYWNAENVANSKVTVLTVPDANQRALLVQTGEIDLAAGIPPKLLAELENDPNVTVHSMPTTGVQYMGMNQSLAPMDNVDLRRAIVAAVPYEALINQVMYGYAQPAQGVVTAAMETHDPSIGGQFTTDLDAAAAHLAASGLSDVTLTLGVRESRSTDQEAAVLIQDNLRQVGINIEVAVLPDSDFAAKLNANELPLFIHDWFSWGEDPFYQMSFLTTCGQFVNYSRFCDEGYDALVEEGKFSLDPAVRADVSSQAQAIFYDQAVWAPLWATDRTVVTGKCVTGVTRDYTLIPPFSNLSKSADC